MTTRQKLIEARAQLAAGELAKARELELFAMDELLQREYAEINAGQSSCDLLMMAATLIREIVDDCDDLSVTRHRIWLENFEALMPNAPDQRPGD